MGENNPANAFWVRNWPFEVDIRSGSSMAGSSFTVVGTPTKGDGLSFFIAVLDFFSVLAFLAGAFDSPKCRGEYRFLAKISLRVLSKLCVSTADVGCNDRSDSLTDEYNGPCTGPLNCCHLVARLKIGLVKNVSKIRSQLGVFRLSINGLSGICNEFEFWMY